ncbi:MAG: glutaredoxin family protein [Polyangiales bacterium]
MRSLAVVVLLLASSFGCAASRPQLSPAGPPVSTEAPVIVYGARWCQHTRAALDYLRGRSIPVRFRDVEQDPDAWDEMMSRARAAHVEARGIPVLSVRDRVLVGYHQDEVDRALQD